MSKTTAGPRGRGAPSPERHVQFVRSASGAGSGHENRGYRRLLLLPGDQFLPLEEGPALPKVTRWTRNAKRRRHGGGEGGPGPPTARHRAHPPRGPGPPGRGHRRPPAAVRAHRLLARGLPRRRPPARRVAGPGHRHPLRSPRRAQLPGRRGVARGIGRRAAEPPGACRGAERVRRPRRLTGHRRDGRRRERPRTRAGPASAVASRCAMRSTSRARRAQAPGWCWCGPAPCVPTPALPSTRHRPRTGPGWPGWSASTIRGWPAASSPRACSTAGCAAICGPPRCCWPRSRSCCASTSWSTALGRVFRSPRQQNALQRAYAATWFSRFLVTVVIALALLAVLAAGGRRDLARHLAGARRRRPARPPGPAARRAPAPSRTPRSRSTGRTLSTRPGRPSRPAPRASSPAGRSSPS